MVKFENCSDYYDWNDRERLCHLRASLEGPAGQVLWDAGQQSSVNEVIRLLNNRFGSLNEEERYRCELKARRRHRGESLQTVYQDIRRLMALAFPGQSGPLWEIMARDTFLESLGDPALRLRVLERDPETLEQALKLATRLEALRQSELEDNWGGIGRVAVDMDIHGYIHGYIHVWISDLAIPWIYPWIFIRERRQHQFIPDHNSKAANW